ncbi:MAG: hypothetical protein LC777_12435 [Actinobacteria bacterium]|nr:hypothetical protein [Actinomycetota bacterium]
MTGVDERGRRAVAAQLDPFAPSAAADDLDVVLSLAGLTRPLGLIELHNAAAGDATVTGWNAAGLHLRMSGRWCRLPDLLHSGPMRFELELGFPLERAFRELVRPALQIALLRRGHVAVHGTTVELDGRGIIVAGWSESGKTETALALMERGAGFLTDKWTVVGTDATLTAFPIGVGVRRWALPYLPRLSAALPARSRAQFAVAATANATFGPLRRRARGRVGGLLADTTERAVALADRAALTPSQLRAAYRQEDEPGRHVPLGGVALLLNVDGDDVFVQEADPAWAAERLARSAAFERRPWFALQERARYAAPGQDPDEPVEAVVARERTLLQAALATAQVLVVRTPFPIDPRRTADAIARALR